jgi:hypothetical protein
MLKNTVHSSYKNYAIWYRNDSLSMFGSGVDLRINELKNGNKSYTNLGYTFELPPGCNQE